MMKLSAVVLMWCGLVACSSETDGTGSSSGGGTCADISGNYSVTSERESGTCDPALDPKDASSVGVQKAADGTWTILIPGVTGGCPGTFDAASCKLTSACEFTGTDGSNVGTTSFTYTFTSAGFTGSTAGGFRPPVVTTACDVTYRDIGTKL